ncbi:MAG: glycosyltransferase family 2 protein, partial [Verrucomicrobiae bacterium]|nr:glycosyltransferase family 2 protein [Verrucomicrobiae bacterium]
MNGSPSPTFSLIVPTIRRLGDLEILFDSLLKSDFQDFEVIVVDQNEGPLIDDLCEKYGARFPLRHLKISKCGGARARNYGHWFARGTIIYYPDDDCALTPGLLGEVARRFSEEPGLDIQFGRSVDPTTGASSVNRFSDQAQPVTLDNLYYTTVEFTMFARRSVIEEVGPFDETLGVGTYYGADEGADFFLRALYLGKVVRYDPALVFHHPQKTGVYDEKE